MLINVEAPPPLTAVGPEPQPEQPNDDQGGTFGGTSPADDGGGGTFEDCVVPPGRDPGDVGC
jgi:hypothetical protein